MTSNTVDAFDDVPSDTVHPPAVAKRATWGIFHIAYEPVFWRAKFAAFSFKQPLVTILGYVPYTWGFLSELFCIAPKSFVSYLLSFFWVSITPALSLYLSYVIIDTVRTSKGMLPSNTS